MKTIGLEQAAELIDRMARGEVSDPAVVLVDGRPVAKLVPLDDLDAESFVLMRNPSFVAMLEESRRQVQETGGLSSEEVRRELGIKPATRRASRRATAAKR